MSDQLKSVLPVTIAENQMAFVANQQIIDASLMANKLIDDWHSSHKQGVVVKLNLEKALLLIRLIIWDFLDAIVRVKGFGALWRKWIFGCISSAKC